MNNYKHLLKMLNMKTLRLIGLICILLSGSMYTFAQGGRVVTCMDVIPGLTEDQRVTITELVAQHQTAMAELRMKQRATYVPAEKNSIRGEMLQKVQAHRKEVRNLLTEEQQRQYEMLHASNAYGNRNMSVTRGGGRRLAGCNGRGFRGRL
jgi:hypothetical protein